MAAPEITILKNNVPWGPFTRAQVDDAILRGDFTLKYLAHAPGLNEWLPLGEVLDFIERQHAPLPPVPMQRDLPPIPQARPAPSTPPVPTPTEARPPILPATPPKQVAPALAPAVESKPPVEPKPEIYLTPAPFFRRAFAFFLDGAIIFLPVLILALFGTLCIEMPRMWHHTSAQSLSEEWGLLGQNATRLSWIVIAFGWLYGAACESSERQATIGKRWLGVQVVDLDGGRLHFFHAMGRNLLKYASGGLCFLGFFLALFGSRNLSLHDRLAATRVIRE